MVLGFWKISMDFEVTHKRFKFSVYKTLFYENVCHYLVNHQFFKTSDLSEYYNWPNENIVQRAYLSSAPTNIVYFCFCFVFFFMLEKKTKQNKVFNRSLNHDFKLISKEVNILLKKKSITSNIRSYFIGLVMGAEIKMWEYYLTWSNIYECYVLLMLT